MVANLEDDLRRFKAILGVGDRDNQNLTSQSLKHGIEREIL